MNKVIEIQIDADPNTNAVSAMGSTRVPVVAARSIVGKQFEET